MEARDYEPYVDADAVAAFLKIKRKTVLERARRGIVPADAWGQGRRRVWRFLISEITSVTALVWPDSMRLGSQNENAGWSARQILYQWM